MTRDRTELPHFHVNTGLAFVANQSLLVFATLGETLQESLEFFQSTAYRHYCTDQRHTRLISLVNGKWIDILVLILKTKHPIHRVEEDERERKRAFWSRSIWSSWLQVALVDLVTRKCTHWKFPHVKYQKTCPCVRPQEWLVDYG